MRACILSIGSELMLGQITDTNASWLARDLAEAGIDLVQVTQVGDNQPLLLRAMQNSLEIADLVICTGGIGPTDDDLTRETIASLVDETPEVDPDLLRDLEQYFTDLGRVMPPRNAKQAWTIPSAEVVDNPVGTAPGWFVSIPDADSPKFILTMPGVPREMYRMWAEQMRPRVLAQTEHHIIDTLQIKTIGIGESDAEERIHDLVLAGDPEVATYAKDDGVHIRVTAVGMDADEVRTRREGARDEIYRRLGQFVWGVDGDTLAGVIAREMADRGYRLALHEIGTGGAFASLLETDPASARSYVIDVVEPISNGDRTSFTWPGSEDDLRVTITYSGDIDEQSVSRGTMDLCIEHATLQSPIEKQWQIRGSVADVQRRIGLNAVHALHTWLEETNS